MAERSCRPAFSLPFHGLIVARQVDFSDEVPDQFNLLPAVSAGLIRRMYNDLLYKLIDDGERQFTNAHIFPYNILPPHPVPAQSPSPPRSPPRRTGRAGLRR